MNPSQVKKILGLIAILAFLVAPSLRATVTITSFGVSPPVVDGQSMTLFVQVSYTYNFSGWSGTIDWGDGTTTATNASNASTISSFTHTYTTNGPLVITLNGTGAEYFFVGPPPPIFTSNPISNSVAITVLPVVPAIKAQPQSQTVLLTSNANFSATALGSLPRVYQWYFNGAAIAGGTNSSLTVSNATLSRSGNYQLIVTNIAGSATSSVATLFVLPSPGYSVPWFKIAGGGGTSTSAVYSISGTFGQHDAGGPMFGGGYQATLGFWSLLRQQSALPVIINPPQNLIVTNGPLASFTVFAVGSAPLSYRWQKNGTNLADNANLSGSATSNLLVTVTGTNNAGNYSVVVANGFGSVTSSVATLTLYFSPAVTQQPTNTGVALGGTTTLGVNVAGIGPFTYQWLYNGLPVPVNEPGTITTVAGGGGGEGLAATNVSLYYPYGAAVDSAGNLFIADAGNNRIRKVSTNGVITTVAGSGGIGYSGDGGTATNANLYSPTGVAVDSVGNLFIADQYNNRIRKVSTSGVITTVAGNGYGGDGGTAISASLSRPTGVAVDSAGNLFIADVGNNRIRKVSTSGIITTVAGTGTYAYAGDGGAATNANLYNPTGVAVDSAGNLFIADQDNNCIRKVSTSGIISTVAGNGGFYGYGGGGDGGAATSAGLYNPTGVAVDSAGNLFIADNFNFRIRKVSTSGIITTVAGNGTFGSGGDGGTATSANLSRPTGMAVDSAGNLFIADAYNNRIRKVNTGGVISTVAGNGNAGYLGDGGAATSASLNRPTGVAVGSAGNLFIADQYDNRIRKVSTGGIITTAAGNGIQGYAGDDGAATNANLNNPSGLAVDSTGNLFIADAYNNCIRKVSTSGIITTVAGNRIPGYAGDGGTATNANLNNPSGLAVDSTGNLFIADQSNHRIRKVIPSGIITTVAGNGTSTFGTYGSYSGDGGAATSAGLNNPSGLAVDTTGNLFIADQYNNRIRKVSTSGVITTVAGNGYAGGDGGGSYSGDGGAAISAGLNNPSGVAVDSVGNLFIADVGNNRIRKVSTSGIITTMAGTGSPGYNGDNQSATSAYINYPYSVAMDAAGNLFIADEVNQRIRKVIAPNENVLADGSLVLKNVSLASLGYYSVIINNAYGSVTSSVPLAVTGLPFSFMNTKGSLGIANRQFYLTLTGPLGSNTVISATTNLQNWTPLVTNPITFGWLNFTDTLATNFPNRFYRATLQP